MFRGSPGLVGVAAGQLPEAPGLLWSFKTEGPVKSSAAIEGGRVFVGSDDGNVYALELASGKKVWAFKTQGPVESSPLVLKGKVYFGSTDANVYAVDAKSGKQVWKYETGDKILSGPELVPAGGGRSVGAGGQLRFQALLFRSDTGKTNWTYETGNYINGSPAVANGTDRLRRVRRGGACDLAGDGEKVKEIDAGAYIAASVAVVENRAYFGHYENEFLCVDLAAGNVAWRFKDRPFPYFSSPAVVGDGCWWADATSGCIA